MDSGFRPRVSSVSVVGKVSYLESIRYRDRKSCGAFEILIPPNNNVRYKDHKRFFFFFFTRISVSSQPNTLLRWFIEIRYKFSVAFYKVFSINVVTLLEYYLSKVKRLMWCKRRTPETCSIEEMVTVKGNEGQEWIGMVV